MPYIHDEMTSSFYYCVGPLLRYSTAVVRYFYTAMIPIQSIPFTKNVFYEDHPYEK